MTKIITTHHTREAHLMHFVSSLIQLISLLPKSRGTGLIRYFPTRYTEASGNLVKIPKAKPWDAEHL